MNKEKFLICFMVLAIAALVILQGYWVQNAFEVNKEQFNRNVRAALIETIRKLDQSQMIAVARQRLADLKSGNLDSEQSLSPTPKETPTKEITPPNSFFSESFYKKREVDIGSIGENSPKNSFKELDYINHNLKKENEMLRNFIQRGNNFESKYDEIERLNKWLDSSAMQKPFTLNQDEFTDEKFDFGIIKSIVSDLILGERNLSERLNYTMLDTLLKNELKNMGISTPYQFAVEEKGEIVLASSQKINLNDVHRIRLFPDDSFQKSRLLLVSFPEKDNFIYKKMTGIFILSFALILLVGGIFYYSATSLISERRLAKLKNDFINNMTHELKTPVSSISLALQFIQDKNIDKTEEKKSRYLGIIQEENKRLSSQIERVLEMAKLEQKQINLNKESVSIHQVLEDVIASFEMRLSQINAKLNLHLHAQEHLIEGDQIHLSNVFYNLIDNAIKYSKGNLDLEISSSNAKNDEIRIDVKDNGIGISSHDINRVFDKFYRVYTGDIHNVKGYGLGLSYVKNMLELHDGSVFLKSKEGEGSTFTIILPTNGKDIIS